MRRRRVDPRGEQGIALTVAIMSLALMIMLGSVALKQAVAALGHTNQETNIKRALQAADAAIDDATYAVARADIGNTLDVDILDPTSLLSQNCIVSTGTVAGIDLSLLDPLTPKDPSGQRLVPGDDGADDVRRRHLQLPDIAARPRRRRQLRRQRRAQPRPRRRRRRPLRRRHPAGQGAPQRLPRGALGRRRPGLRDRDLAGGAHHVGHRDRSSATPSPTAPSPARGLNAISGNATPGQNGTVSGVDPGRQLLQGVRALHHPRGRRGGRVRGREPVHRQDVRKHPLHHPAAVPGPADLRRGHPDADRRRHRPGDAAGRGDLHVLLHRGEGQRGAAGPTRGATRGSSSTTPPTAATATARSIREPGPSASPRARASSTATCRPSPSRCRSTRSAARRSRRRRPSPASALSTTGLLNVCGTAATLTGVPMTIIAPHSTIALGSSTAIAGQVAGEVVNMTGASKVHADQRAGQPQPARREPDPAAVQGDEVRRVHRA